MICRECHKGKYENKLQTEEFTLDGGPTILLKNQKVSVCPVCGDEIVTLNDTRERNKEILAFLVDYYAHRNYEISGKAAKWIRKTIGLSAVELAESVGVSPTNYSQAIARESNIDQLSALTLCWKVIDFITENNIGSKLLQEMRAPEKKIDKNLYKNVEVA